jgi:hypothetical protein
MDNPSQLMRVGKAVGKEVFLICTTAAILIFSVKEVNQFRSAGPAVPNHAQTMSGPLVSVGSHIGLQSVDFAGHPESLILVCSPTCPYCLQSKPFHQKLFAEARRSNVPFYLVVPEQHNARVYANSVGVPESGLREWKSLGVRVAGTPSLIAVDSSGTTRRVWVGHLPSEAEVAVIKIIQTPALLASSEASSQSGTHSYSLAELRKRGVSGKVRMIDVHERGDYSPHGDVINIPLFELPIRAEFDLDKRDLQVIDCTNLGDAECGDAVQLLSKSGFLVETQGAGSIYQSCDSARVTSAK